MECPTLVLAGDCDHWLGVGLMRGIEDVVAAPEVHSHWIQQDRCDMPPLSDTAALAEPEVAFSLPATAGHGWSPCMRE